MDLASFERQAWAIVEPDTPLIWGWEYDYLCEWLTLVASGEFKRLYPDKLGIIINIPPRSGKSTFATVNFPVWTWLKYKSRRFLFGSHSLSLACTHNGKRNYLIGHRWFQERFGDRFKLVAAGASLTQNDHTGRFKLASITSKQTGEGGLILIGDDLLDREDAFSASVKLKTNNWIDSSFSKMLDDAVRGVTVHISQRLAVDDPTGHLLGEDIQVGDSEGAARLKAQWICVKIRREATVAEEYVYPISGQVHSRPKGDILQAQRCPPMVLVHLQAKARTWANQEQQEPTPVTGALLNPNHIQWFRASTPLPSFFQVIVSVDANFKEGKDNDLVAMHKYAIVFKRKYLLDRRTEQLGFGASKQAIKELARGGHRVSWLNCPMPAATQVLIENKANGPAIAEQLRCDPEFPLAVIEYNPVGGSKTERFIAACADAEARLIYFPEDAPWIGELRKVLCDYAGEGSIKHDDDCDAWSQLVNWSRHHQYGLLGYLEKQAAEEAGTREIHRCKVEDPDVPGQTLILEWDEAQGLWFDPKNPARTYAPAAPEAEATESPADGTVATEAPGVAAEGESGDTGS